MVIYSRNPEGKITHSPVREVSYSQKTLKSFLTELKRLNPDIELDPEYEQFLAGTYSLRTITKHTMQSVEQKLRDKGERW
jgi:FMN-dependent NADH-azoreductase